MMSFARGLFVVASLVGMVATSAYAVTTPKITYHCVNAKNQGVRGANTQAQCKAPYRWIKMTATAQNPKKAKGNVASAKSPKKGHVASAVDPKD